MSKETFGFSEALKRMREGKKVRRNKIKEVEYLIDNNDIFIIRNGTTFRVPHIPTNIILETDWEETSVKE